MPKPQPKRRRISSSDEDEHEPNVGDADLEESFLDVSCRELDLSPPMVVATPESEYQFSHLSLNTKGST